MQYQLLPSLMPDEYEALKADIRARGVQVPVEYDEQGHILDGHHRVQICRELGIPDWPRVVRTGMSEEQKIEHVLALNLNRRHLNEQQRGELVAKLRTQGLSIRSIAHALRTGVNQVQNDIQVYSVDTPDKITGRDGKQYPARKSTDSHESVDIGYDPEANQAIAYAEEMHERAERMHYADVPHVAHNSGDNEWYTPPEYIQAARRVMGGIDLDPASSAIANETVKAAIFYDSDDNGLAFQWGGRVWMNPPYAAELIVKFVDKLAQHVRAGDVTECIVLVNNATETRWFNQLIAISRGVVFTTSRVRFLKANGEQGAPLQGQAILYHGRNIAKFMAEFSQFGWCAWLSHLGNN